MVVDVRSLQAWDQGHLPAAVHLPDVTRATEVLPDRDDDLVVLCWGPGCNASTKAALALVGLGCTRVRELIGGYEHWVREGFAVVTPEGRVRRSPEPLTAPIPD